MYSGFPGRWTWELAWRRPDVFRLTLRTTGEDQTFLSDGETIRTFLGNRLVTEEPAKGACDPSVALWVAVAGLDALEASPFAWRELPAAALPAGAARGAEATCGARAEVRYRLLFDGALRLVELSGPVDVPVLGPAHLVARFADFRREDGYRLPHRIGYRRDGERFLDETVTRWRPGADTAPDALVHPPS